MEYSLNMLRIKEFVMVRIVDIMESMIMVKAVVAIFQPFQDLSCY